MMKKIGISLILCAALIAGAVPALAATPAVSKTEYEGSGYVEVDFRRDVQYKKAKVTVKDSSGNNYTASIREKDEDDLTFQVKGIKPGKTYSYTISGVRAGRSGKYTKVSGKFSTPSANQLAIKSVDYDRSDRELEVEFNAKVQYRDLKVSVTDADGKFYAATVRDKDRDSIELRVQGLQSGGRYSVSISGVRSGEGSYGSISKAFRAIDD